MEVVTTYTTQTVKFFQKLKITFNGSILQMVAFWGCKEVEEDSTETNSTCLNKLKKFNFLLFETTFWMVCGCKETWETT